MAFVYNPFTGNLDKQNSVSDGNQPVTITDIIPANSSKVVDSVNLNTFKSANYLSFIDNDAESVRMSFISYVYKTVSGISDQLFARDGSVNAEINFNINGTNVEFLITNNNNFDLNISYQKSSL
jgi:hypothetical protein